MIEKYFNGVIEQVYHRIGTAEKNIVMASYNNDFSLSGLENKKRYQEAFLRECGTYELHRSLFLGYYEDGICKREEGVLLNEV